MAFPAPETDARPHYGGGMSEQQRCFTAAERALLPAAMDDLTPKQREVARLVLAGYSLTAIADRLGLGDNTVRGFMRRIKHRLHKS